MDEHKNLAHFYWIQKIIWIGPGPDRSSNLGPKTVKTGPKTDTGPVFARTDPTLVGTDVNPKKAFELYLMAANLGDDFAQANLGWMYEKGDGIEKNIDHAIYWYKESAKQEYKYAKNKLMGLLVKK